MGEKIKNINKIFLLIVSVIIALKPIVFYTTTRYWDESKIVLVRVWDVGIKEAFLLNIFSLLYIVFAVTLLLLYFLKKMKNIEGTRLMYVIGVISAILALARLIICLWKDWGTEEKYVVGIENFIYQYHSCLLVAAIVILVLLSIWGDDNCKKIEWERIFIDIVYVVTLAYALFLYTRNLEVTGNGVGVLNRFTHENISIMNYKNYLYYETDVKTYMIMAAVAIGLVGILMKFFHKHRAMIQSFIHILLSMVSYISYMIIVFYCILTNGAFAPERGIVVTMIVGCMVLLVPTKG